MPSFKVVCKPSNSFKLFFHYRYVKIPNKVVATWKPSDYISVLQYYKLEINSRVLESMMPRDKIILKSLLDEGVTVQMTHPIHPSNCYFRAFFPINFIAAFKKIFISTLVYHNKTVKISTPESVTFVFDTDKKSVTIDEIIVLRPENNPYFEYAQNAALIMSTEAIGLCNFQSQENEIRDFYDLSNITSWRERSQLLSETLVADRPGIYMLYNRNNNKLYVGKGIRVVERIIQHTKNPYDPIQDFTHYRYSPISEEYIEFLYLIENAAIHDIAWLIKMPAAKKFKQSLAEKIEKGGMSIQNCLLVNTVEHQTRKQ